MSYTHYLLEKDAPEVEVIEDFVKKRNKQLDALNAFLEEHGAYDGKTIMHGRDTTALCFIVGEQPDGWAVLSKYKRHSFGIATYGPRKGEKVAYYSPKGPAHKETRAVLRSLRVANGEDFTNAFQDMYGINNMSFFSGMVLRQLAFQQVGDEYIISIPDGGKKIVPGNAQELLNSEYKAYAERYEF